MMMNWKKERRKSDATIKKMMWNNEYLLQGVVADVHDHLCVHLSFSTRHTGCGKSSSINTGSRPVRETLLGSNPPATRFQSFTDNTCFLPQNTDAIWLLSIKSIDHQCSDKIQVIRGCNANSIPVYLFAYPKRLLLIHSIWHCLAVEYYGMWGKSGSE